MIKIRVRFRVTIKILMLVYLAINAFTAFGSALRCGGRLISEGDTKLKMLAKCGEPQDIQFWEEERIFRYYPRATYNYNQHYDDEFVKPYFIKKHILIEEWTYNHGPHRFMDHIRLENGRVIKIISGEYGH